MITENPDGTPDRGLWKGIAPEQVREELKKMRDEEPEEGKDGAQKNEGKGEWSACPG